MLSFRQRHSIDRSNVMKSPAHQACTHLLLFCLALFASSTLPAAQLDIPGPPGSGAFGAVTLLPNGNFVVVDTGFDLSGPVVSNVGAVYLYAPDGTLISTLTGSTAGDQVGNDGITVLSNGNYVVRSRFWDNLASAALNAGAVTWGNGSTGVSGLVSASNSLVGGTTGDEVGRTGITALSNGSYVVRISGWDNPAPLAANVGAVTWGSGSTGVSGLVSASNSLVGGTADDSVGNLGITALSNGNYVVVSSNWDNGATTNAGAVTWGSGSTGVSGLVSASNSLVGGTASDLVGSQGITILSNGNYVVRSEAWDNLAPAAVDAGAVTWGSGSSGVSGLVSASNSLVGGTASDQVGSTGITILSNGNYVLRSSNWDNLAPAAVDAGAVTWGNDGTGVSGLVSASNSLVGGTASDQVGLNGATALSNGNYVVGSSGWDKPAPSPVDNVGAVTWGNGSSGTVGLVSASNSLVGSTLSDQVGLNGATALSNGNYVVRSTNWDNPSPAAADVGAVTWGDGSAGVVGLVSASNSLVGGAASDSVGSTGVTVLSNGNYVVSSDGWDNLSPAAVDAGAVTWGDGSAGVVGLVSASNSLVGGTASDAVGGQFITFLSNGNYVVISRNWDNGAATNAGAVTWGNGSTGVSGLISASNSLVGGTAGDLVGAPGITALSNGNYVVRSEIWDNLAPAAVDAGAVTWGNGSTGISGLVSASNSLVGGTLDRVGRTGITVLSNGNYVVRSNNWNNIAPAATDAGAITWGNGSTGVSGLVSASNSLVGGTASDQVGSTGITALSNGNYVVRTSQWDNPSPAALNVGAISRGLGNSAVVGLLDASNSVRGTTANGGTQQRFGYDLAREQLIVGRPADNIVTIFNDLAAPGATTLPAGPVSTTAASLNGLVDANGLSTSVSFNHGLTPALGSSIAATPATVSDGTDTPVSASLSGLTANTRYYFQVSATNSMGTTLGLVQSFVTTNAGLQVGAVTLPATRISANNLTRVRFAQAFASTPVVIVQGGDEDADPQTLRLRNIDSSGFDLLQVEAPGCNSCTGAGGTTVVHWLAALPGSYRLSNDVLANPTILQSLRERLNERGSGPGVLIKVGTLSTNASQRSVSAGGFGTWPTRSYSTVTFPVAGGALDFASAPIVLSSVQSWNQANEGFNLNLFSTPSALTGVSQPWASTVLGVISATAFDVALESSEVDNDEMDGSGFGAAESIGYVAIENNVSVVLNTLGAGATVGLATGPGSATGSCSDTDLSFPIAAVITPANLRGFASKQSRLEDDGGWLRRCALSNPAGQTVRMGVRVDEDANRDLERTHATAETLGTAIFGGDLQTTPVTLARVRVEKLGERLQVRFASATEVGQLGFRIWGRSSAEHSWQTLHEGLLLSSADDVFAGRSYQLDAAGQVSNEPVRELRIEDIDILGQSRFHPTLQLNDQQSAELGSDAISQPLDWTAIRAANAQSPMRVFRSDGTPAVALLEVKQAGIQRVRFEDLQALGFTAGTPATQIALLDEGRSVLRHVSCAQLAAGCFIEFLGKARESLYGSGNVYTLNLDASLARPVASGALRAGPGELRVYTEELRQAPNRSYSFSAPGNDPWFDEFLQAATTPVQTSRTFNLSERAPGPVQLQLDVWGGTDFPGDAPDHAVEVLLNGQLVASRRFNGLVAERIEATLPEAQLQTSNTLTVRLPADTGYAADVVLLDGFVVRYPRRSSAADGQLRIGTVASEGVLPDMIHADSFESRLGLDMRLDGVQNASVLWTQSGNTVSRDVLSAPSSLDRQVSGLVLQSESAISVLMPKASVPPAQSNTPVDYLIVTHPLFEAGLAPLLALQQQRGYRVRVLRTDQIYAERSDHAADPEAIRSAIAAINPRFVLLVGGDSYDYENYLGLGSQSYLPTFYRTSNRIVRFAASDLPFVDINEDGTPERAIGRVPARTLEEFERAVQSIVARGTAAPTRFFASAGISAAQENFAQSSRSMLSYLRQGQPLEFGLVDEIGETGAREKTRAALAGSADWITYLGHSSPNRWALQNLLDTSQLASISRIGTPAIVSQLGCWNNYFVLPNQDTMAHALMLRPNRLAAAVLGASSLAEDASHLAFGTRLFDLVEDGNKGDENGSPVRTLGEAVLRAKQDLAQYAPEYLEANYTIVLFGDPATPLR